MRKKRITHLPYLCTPTQGNSPLSMRIQQKFENCSFKFLKKYRTRYPFRITSAVFYKMDLAFLFCAKSGRSFGIWLYATEINR